MAKTPQRIKNHKQPLFDNSQVSQWFQKDGSIDLSVHFLAPSLFLGYGTHSFVVFLTGAPLLQIYVCPFKRIKNAYFSWEAFLVRIQEENLLKIISQAVPFCGQWAKNHKYILIPIYCRTFMAYGLSLFGWWEKRFKKGTPNKNVIAWCFYFKRFASTPWKTASYFTRVQYCTTYLCRKGQ